MKMSLMLALALVLSSGVRAAELKVIAGGGIAMALNEIAAQFERDNGHKITIRYGTAPELIVLAKTTPFDLALTPSEVFRDADAAAKLAPGALATIARVGLAVGVPAGAAKPDIATPEALKQALLSAKSVATLPSSAAGAQVMKMFERLGIANEVKAKLVPATSPPKLVELLADRQAEIGVFLINVLTADGLDVIGPVPAELNQDVVYVSNLAAAAQQAEVARTFLAFLQSPQAKAILKAKGLTPS
jgi:molybdate transport system substrate-binding protein